jgi:leader peptidase (prepilin peptidase)/N-methyltransferase
VAQEAGVIAAWFWPVALGLLGAIVGSFIAALVIRWPARRSVLRGRSTCDACARVLAPFDLVPLVSAMVLRGRCRNCHAPIDPRHWQIELTALLIGGIAGMSVAGPMAIAGALFGWLLLALAALDVTAFWLPDRLTVALAVTGIAAGLLGVPPTLGDRLIGGGAGFAALWAIARGYRRIRHREGMGGGDPKLFGAIGLWIGWRLLPMVLVLACLVGLDVVALRLIRGNVIRGDDRLPLGALLAIAAYPIWIVMIASSP